MLWSYIPLLQKMQSPVPVIGLQARGLDDDSLPSEDLKQIATEYLEEIIRIQPKGPYFLGGHSMGGLIGYEIARQLQDRGESIERLVMLDSSASGQNGAVVPESTVAQERTARSLADMASALGRFSGDENLELSFEELSVLDPDDQVDALVENLAMNENLPFRPDTVGLQRLLRVSETLVQASRAYRPKPSSVPITLIRAKDVVKSNPVAVVSGREGDESLGWSALAEDPIDIAWAPGDHITMMNESSTGELAELVGTRLNKAVNSASYS